jgi:hypothetical protein
MQIFSYCTSLIPLFALAEGFDTPHSIALLEQKASKIRTYKTKDAQQIDIINILLFYISY